MKASYRFICELIPELRVSAEELATSLTGAGLAVDGVEQYGAAASACLVARVTQARPHPERANLRLVTVELGSALPQEEVVCGAPNVPAPGGLVVFAPVGTFLPAKNLTIEPRKVAGVESRGMLCSEAELGLTDDASGLMILPPGVAAPGTPLSTAMPETRDVVFELDVTPNRPDALGHVGIARDVAALYGLTLALPLSAESATNIDTKPASPLPVQVRIDDLERCPHFGAAVVQDVKLAASPAWLRYRLSSLGVRPISNVVDITNLLMLEWGHPMHAYDLERVHGAQIIVRRAQGGETLTTLDGVRRDLLSDDLVICDAKSSIGLAGVMGGADSEVHDGTRHVLFECAYFEPRGVRRSSRRHGLHTEASHRFERGVDPANAAQVLARATQLTTQLAQGSVLPGQLHVGAPEPTRRTLTLSFARVSQLIGEPIPSDEIMTTLRRLGCELGVSPQGADPDVVLVALPTHRPDLLRSVDLIAEVARIRGIDRVQPVLPAIRPTRDAGPREALVQQLRGVAVAVGLSEAITFAFVSESDLQKVGAPAASVVLKNPINELHTVMRTSLVPGLLDAAARARRHGRDDVQLFSIGARYLPTGTKLSEHPLPEERLSFAAVVTGARPSYLQKPVSVDVWDAKGLAEAIVQRFTRRSAHVLPFDEHNRPKHLHPRGAARLLVDTLEVGSFGPLHPDVAQAFELDSQTLVLELDAAALGTLRTAQAAFREIPRFPASRRDLAVVVHDDVQAGAVLRAIRDAAGDLAEHVEMFDRFTGGAIPKQHASLAFRVVYRAAARTLTDAEVDERHNKVVAEIERTFGAQLRGA